MTTTESPRYGKSYDPPMGRFLAIAVPIAMLLLWPVFALLEIL